MSFSVNSLPFGSLTGRALKTMGRSLRIALLGCLLLITGCFLPRWPVDAPVTSPFGLRTEGSSLGLHRGVDFQLPDGTEVRAMAGGRVRFSGTQSGFGQVIWLEHSSSVLTVYAHLSAIHVQAGENVRNGQVIGLSGHSGNVTGSHLHFEIWRNGREVDPVPLLGSFPGGGG
jgi:murein DD-endopeptidase MepM/ murein hydrolase activator NlpD